jgi:transcriptional regulator with XRE-family HTH domain
VDLAGRIRAERKARRISQEALARQAGMSLRALNSLERGEAVDPHYSTLVGLADALDMSISELLEESQAPLTQASPPPEPVEKRRALNYETFEEFLNDFCGYWEGRYFAEDFSEHELDDFAREETWITPILSEVWETQLDELRKRLGREPTTKEPSLWLAIERFMDIRHSMREKASNASRASEALKDLPVSTFDAWRKGEDQRG